MERNAPRRRVHDRDRVHVVVGVQRDVSGVGVSQPEHRRRDDIARVLGDPSGRSFNPHGRASGGDVVVDQHPAARVQR